MIETAAERDPVKTEADSQHMLGQGGNRVRCGSDSSTNSNGSYSTDQYRSSLPTCREEYISEAEEFVYSMLAPAESLDTASDCARDITGARSSAAGLCTPTKDLRREGDWDSVERKGQEPFGLSISQQVGPPPEALLHVYERARKCLEEIWHCDMVIFETVEKLAQCLLLKEQTWQRLRRVRAEESVIVTPDLEDLYDIDL
ncbi:unnamed protein product [Symbiodinium microadriaticum]|nr:unnamed protein product [Symbiodinium microadriaticum]